MLGSGPVERVERSDALAIRTSDRCRAAGRVPMTVGYEVRDEIAFISFNRPEKHNAFFATRTSRRSSTRCTASTATRTPKSGSSSGMAAPFRAAAM